MSSDEFRRRGHELVDWIASYLDTVENRPVAAHIQPGDLLNALPQHAPERGESWDDIFADVDRVIMPAVTHWQHPQFHAYFPGNGSYPAILGDLLSTGLGVNGFLWATCPAITELETRVLDWLGKMLALPPTFLSTSRDEHGKPAGGGVIQGTASEAAVVAMIAGVARAKRQLAMSGTGGTASVPPPCPLPRGGGSAVVYCSSQAHSSIEKATMVTGVGRENVRRIGVDHNLAMRTDELERVMLVDIENGCTPSFVCATIGTTSTTAIDPVRAIGQTCDRIAQRTGVRPWLHIDAAFAGAALVCPEFRWMSDGVELADSFNFNPHKWLLTSFDCSALWVRDRKSLTEALSITPAYLRNAASESGSVIDYRDWQIPLGRRFRALKLWFVIRHYGVEGLRAHIRQGVRLGELFETLVRGDERFEIVTPRVLSLVCFRLKSGDEANRTLVDRVNRTGRVLLTQSIVPLNGRDTTIVRMAIGGTQTTERHVREAWELIRTHV